MRQSAKIITALSVTGLAVAAGSAFTGAGATSLAGTDQFIGGTVSQTVTGATLNSLVYGFEDGDTTKTKVNKVTLTFNDATGSRTPTLTLAGGTAVTFTCTPITLTDTQFKSICSTAVNTSQTGVTGASVTVADAA